MVFRKKKKEDEFEDEEEDYDDEMPEPPAPRRPIRMTDREFRKARRTGSTIPTPKERGSPADRYTAIQQPELIGIRDNDSGEVEEFNLAVMMAKVLSYQDEILKRL